LDRITTPCRTAEDVLLLDGTCRGRLQYGQLLAVADLARLWIAVALAGMSHLTDA
jgi:hypothetical protein